MFDVEKIAKWAAILVSIGGFLWSIGTFLHVRAIESRRPFLDYQLKLYTEATSAAALLATSSDSEKLKAAETRFWQLYWGELAMVENGGISAANGGVESAMVNFGSELKQHAVDRTKLQSLSLKLAHTCRDSLAQSWNVSNWKSPNYQKQPQAGYPVAPSDS